MASSSSTLNPSDASMSDSPLSPRTKEFEEKLKDFFEVQTMISGKVVWNHRVDARITRLIKSTCVPWVLSEDQSNPIFNTIQVDGMSLHPFDPDDQAILISIAKPAPLGRGSETVFDETVHKALEIPASRLVVDYKPIALILNAIERRWFNYIFDAKLYKMLIYQETGKFQIHRDTVHDSNHIATLFVSLHQAERGGAMFVQHEHQSTSEWWAFFTDCQYEVKEVMKGCSIVLQYDLYARVRRVGVTTLKIKHSDPSYWNECDFSFEKFMPSMATEWLENTIFPTLVKNQIKEALRALWTPGAKEDFGLLLGHEYVELSANKLIGTDLVLYQIVQEMEEMESELVHVSVKVTEHPRMPISDLCISPILPRADAKPIIVLPSVQFDSYPSLYYRQSIDVCDLSPCIEIGLALVLIIKMKIQ